MLPANDILPVAVPFCVLVAALSVFTLYPCNFCNLIYWPMKQWL